MTITAHQVPQAALIAALILQAHLHQIVTTTMIGVAVPVQIHVPLDKEIATQTQIVKVI